MEKEKGMHFIADIRRTKRTLQEEISKLINKFEKLEQEEGELPKLEIYPIKPEEIHIKLEDI
jgi:sugar-specific transcriptional regulator TrmB